jgi:hypothetical protein
MGLRKIHFSSTVHPLGPESFSASRKIVPSLFEKTPGFYLFFVEAKKSLTPP